jgi:hypothetical protein
MKLLCHHLEQNLICLHTQEHLMPNCSFNKPAILAQTELFQDQQESKNEWEEAKSIGDQFKL